MVKSRYFLLTMLAVNLASTSANATNTAMTYDCDTAAGHFSVLKQNQQGPDYQISGQITAKLTRKHAQDPRGTVWITNLVSRHSVALQLSGEHSSKNGKLLLIYGVSGGERTKQIGTYHLGQPVVFTLRAADDKTLVTVNSETIEVPTKIETGASVGVSCSTGQFIFENLSLR